MTPNEINRHRKERYKVIDYDCFGLDPFKVATIDETDMSYVLSQIPDRHFAKKANLKLLFHNESRYRKLVEKTLVDLEKPIITRVDVNSLEAQQLLKDFGRYFPKLYNFIKEKKTMMKTVLVIYTDRRVENPGYKNPRYAFNTSADVEVGDMINSPQYSTPMQIVAVLDRKFNYFAKTTGQLSTNIINAMSFPIRELRIMENHGQAIYATKMNR